MTLNLGLLSLPHAVSVTRVPRTGLRTQNVPSPRERINRDLALNLLSDSLVLGHPEMERGWGPGFLPTVEHWPEADVLEEMAHKRAYVCTTGAEDGKGSQEPL